MSYLCVCISLTLFLLFPLLVFLERLKLLCIQLFFQRNLKLIIIIIKKINQKTNESVCQEVDGVKIENKDEMEATSWGGFHQRWAMPGFFFTAWSLISS